MESTAGPFYRSRGIAEQISPRYCVCAERSHRVQSRGERLWPSRRSTQVHLLVLLGRIVDVLSLLLGGLSLALVDLAQPILSQERQTSQ